MTITTRRYVCPVCHATAEECDNPFKWRYANAYNSTHFCRCCGTAMSQYDLTDEEIKRYEYEHDQWLEEPGNTDKWY